jgi:hypothetical protein
MYIRTIGILYHDMGIIMGIAKSQHWF